MMAYEMAKGSIESAVPGVGQAGSPLSSQAQAA